MEKGFEFYDDSFFGNPEYQDADVYVSRSARITGRVILEEDVIVCPHVSLRADEGTPFKIRKGTNVQDSVILHGLKDRFVEDENAEKYSILIGSHCTLAHRAMIHGPAKIGKFSFVGFDAIVHGSEVGRNSFVDFRATIKNSVLGDKCHVGIGAIINGVKIANNRFIRDGQVISNQCEADLLPEVPKSVAEADGHFNKEVVDYNKELVRKYQKRRTERDK